MKAKEYFNAFKNTDADYLIIGLSEDMKAVVLVPKEGKWDTLDEAVAWFQRNGWDEIQIYDLYADFEEALMATGSPYQCHPINPNGADYG